MLSRIKTALLVISILALFFIASWVFMALAADPSALNVSEQPHSVSLEDIAAMAANPELRVHDRHAGPIVETEVVDDERLLDYLRWKHDAVPVQAREMMEAERLQEYLRWKHNADLIGETNSTEAERLLEYVQWKHNAVPAQ